MSEMGRNDTAFQQQMIHLEVFSFAMLTAVTMWQHSAE